VLEEHEVRQATLAAAETDGWPQVEAHPGEYAGPGEARWRVFAARAPLDRVRTALTAMTRR
jgi:hypothetical protein